MAKSGIVGSAITLTGYGFLGYVQDIQEVVNVYWGSPTGTLLGSSPTNGQGTSGTINFTVPTVATGTYTLYAVGQASGTVVTATFKVVQPSLQLLQNLWHLVGNNGVSEAYQSINSNVLNGMNTIRITYNLHGLQALSGDASAIIIDQNGWHYISLSDYGQNGLDGVQTVDIPLANFPGLNLSQPIDGTIHTRFWYSSQFTVDITSIVVYHK